MVEPTAIEPADERFSAQMVDAFCAAFADDPGLAWIWPDRDDRLARLPHFFVPIVGGTVHNGAAFRSSDGTAVAMWRKPGRIHPGAEEMEPYRASMAAAFTQGLERSRIMGDVLRSHQPSGDDWWYLQFIGVRPDGQGAGLGSGVARAGLTLARESGQRAYVEVMNPRNLPFYRRLGFETVAQFDIPGGGPHVCAMVCHP